MARRKGVLDELAGLPWPVPAMLGIVAFFYVRHVGGYLAPLAFAVLVACEAAALASFFGTRRRRSLLERRASWTALTLRPDPDDGSTDAPYWLATPCASLPAASCCCAFANSGKVSAIDALSGRM